MPNYTKNLGLTKPLPEEFYDVNVRNENWDKIDKAVGNTNGSPLLDEDGVLALTHRSKLLTNEDLNDIVADGYYRARTTQECLNVPDDVTAFGLLVLRIGENMDTGGNCNQILVPYGSVGNIIYTRTVTEGAWDNWRRIPIADILGNITVGNGMGAFVADNVSVVAEHRKDGNRYGFVAYSNEGIDTRYKVFQDIGGVISQFDLYHTGNLDLSKIGSAGLTPASIE